MKQGDADLWYRDYWKRLREREKVIQELHAPRIHWFHSAGFNEVEQKIFEASRDRRRVLDFGAGDLQLKQKFLAAGFRGLYETMDASPEFSHTYTSLDQIHDRFDAIFCFEVIEHVTLNEYVRLLDRLDGLLETNGILAISTPNPLSSVPMWATDAGHIQQYPLADLVADLRLRGYSVIPYRVCLNHRPRGWAAIRFLVRRVLCYFLSVDYAEGLLLICTKVGAAKPNH
jgi:hypothetical protein